MQEGTQKAVNKLMLDNRCENWRSGGAKKLSKSKLPLPFGVPYGKNCRLTDLLMGSLDTVNRLVRNHDLIRDTVIGPIIANAVPSVIRKSA